MFYNKRTQEYTDLNIRQEEVGDRKLIVVYNEKGEEKLSCECDRISICLGQNKLLPFLTKPFIVVENSAMIYISADLKKSLESKMKEDHGFDDDNVIKFLANAFRYNIYDWNVIKTKFKGNDVEIDEELVTEIKQKKKIRI